MMYERLSKGKREKKARGGYTGGWIPCGYRREKGALVVVPEEAAVVERIFRLKAEGIPPRRIAERLTEEGAITRRGGRWSYSTVWNILRNRFYTGRVELEGKWIPGQHDAIISDALFKSATGKEA
jgi:DNA invertase Pin-like site-specific DNA recombinase